MGHLRWLLRAGDHDRSGHLEALVGRGLRVPSRFQFREDIVPEENKLLIQRFVEEAFDKGNLEKLFRMDET
jgi:hypothetical protein